MVTLTGWRYCTLGSLVGLVRRMADYGKAFGGISSSDRAARLGTSSSGTNLARAGDYNQRVVLQAIRRNPDITRVEIAALTGLTGPTIANITKRLFNADLIVAAGRRQGGVGQPAVRLRSNPDGCFAVGLNIDRDHMTLVSLDLAGAVRSRLTRQIAFAMPEDVRAFVRLGIADILEGGAIVPSRILGLGVAMPDDLGGVALPNMPPGYAVWSLIDVEDLLADIVPWSIHRDNDAAAAAIGEAQFGSGLQYGSFFYILISAGLGGGVVIDGSYWQGENARSGEIGFLPLDQNDPGGAILQDTASLSALAARLEAGGFGLDGADPTEALPAGAEALVESWIADASAALAPPLSAVNCLINPAAVLIGGRLPDSVIERLTIAVTHKLAAMAPNIPVRAPVLRATLSRDAPAVGAAILPFLDRILPSDAALMK